MTHKEHEAEIRYALNAYTEAVKAECAAKQARERANEVLHDKMAALLTEYYVRALEAKPKDVQP